MFELRPYQQEALTALEDYWSRGGGNPLVAMATATGKSVVLAHLVRNISQRFPALRVLIVTHVLELIRQDIEPLLALWPDAPIGINSAGMGQREWDAPIIFAGVQSVWRNAARLGPRNLVLIDEAHLVPHDGDGMYRRLLQSCALWFHPAICGWLGSRRRRSGSIAAGSTKVRQDLRRCRFRLRHWPGNQGWLAVAADVEGDRHRDQHQRGRRGGEFIAGELERAADDSATVSAACDEIVARGVDRRSWLVFCCGVAHAHHVGQTLRARGISCRVVTGETPLPERADSIAAFKAGKVRCLVNVNVLTTGFDAPRVDLLAMLRPTLSTGLYVQMVGRGTRKADGKVNCLVLDFAGNCRRHGPVDQVDIKVGGSSSNGTAVAPATVRTKTCPECAEINPLDAAACCCCDHEWPKPKPAAKHATSADAVPILTGERVWLPVTDVSFHRHCKYGAPGAPPSFRVDYLCGLSPYAEYVSFERQGYPRTCAERWWYALGAPRRSR